MALLKFISLSVGSLMLLQGAYVSGAKDSATTKDCLDLLNKARKEVNLGEFTAVTTKEKQYLTDATANANFLPQVCNQLNAKTPIIISATTAFPGATAAYSLDIEDCSTAIDAWKKGFSSITTSANALPVAYTVASENPKDGDDPKFQTGGAPYNSLAAINFLSLYNGQSGTTVECGVVDCALTHSGVKGLVCMTYPVALKATSGPYNETQWKDILKVFAPSASSASAAVPTLLALAAAAVGVALM